MTTTEVDSEELKQLRAEHDRLFRKYGKMTDEEIDNLIQLKIDNAMKEWLIDVKAVEIQNKAEEKQVEMKKRQLDTQSVVRLAKVRERILITAAQIDDLPDDFESLKKLVTNE